MKENKRGISLIVLIITIIVIIILAAVVILTITNNNPIESAKEAAFKEEVRGFQDELAMTVSKEYMNVQGQRDISITTSVYEEIKEKIPSFYEKYKDKYIIVDDELVGTINLKDKEKKWTEDLGIRTDGKPAKEVDGVLAKDVDSSYYGKNVSNYTLENNSTGEDITWKVFYADENNIYLIPTGAVNLALVPSKDGAKLENTDSKRPKAAPFDNVIEKYPNGAEGITDSKLQYLNSKFFKYLEEKNVTLKKGAGYSEAIAYMMDKDIWTQSFKDKGQYAEYVVGGPTIELLFKSYNKKVYNNVEQYQTKVENDSYLNGYYGYLVSNGGEEAGFSSYLNRFDRLDRYETLFNLRDGSGEGFWLASPSQGGIMIFYYDGGITSYGTTSDSHGFRPMVCLKSDTALKILDDDTVELN